MSPRGVPVRLQGLFWVAVTATGWGLSWPAMKIALLEWPVFTFRAVTSAAGVVLLLALALARGERIWPGSAAQWGRLALAGLLNITPFVGLGTLSLLWLNASEATIVAYTMPIWASMLAWPVLGERPTPARLAGLAMGLAGVAILLAPVVLNPASAQAAKLPGYACILGTAVLFAFGTVLTKRRPLGMPPLASLAWQITFGTLPLILGAMLFDRWQGMHIGLRSWLVALYIVVVGLCVGYLAWFRALRLLPASLAATATLMVPVIGVLSAGLLLGEPLGWRQLTSLGMTVAGIVLASRG
jgi:drug/metabolite transporter (DMT)-like permease